MKRILFFFCAALMAMSSFASDFTNSNKKSSGFVYSVGEYSVTSNVAVATLTQAKNARTLFSISGNIFYRNAGGQFCVTDGTNSTELTGSPSFGDKVLTGLSDNANYVDLFDAIVASENTLPSLALNMHGDWGSQKSEAASLSAAIKSEVGAISNNNPYLNFENAIKTAQEVFNNKNTAPASYAAALEDLTTAETGNKSMFDKLEVLRDSLGLLKQSYEGTRYIDENNNEATASHALSAYPCASDMFTTSFNQALDDYKFGATLATIEGDIAMVKSTEECLFNNVSLYSDDDLAFFDKMQDPTSYQEATSKNDYPTIANISYVEYALFIKVPGTQMVDAGVKFGKECASWAGSAPFVSYPGIAMATAQFAINMTFAGMLMAENIKHMQTLQSCIDWLNNDCQSDYAYSFLTDEVGRSRMNLRTCDNSAIAEEQHNILKRALERATELSLLGESQKAIQDMIVKAQDAYYNMATTRANKLENLSVAKVNLGMAIARAEQQKDIQYVNKNVKYDYAADEYDLYDWVKGPKSYTDVTPHFIVDRECKILENALALYNKQYELEQKLDECMNYMDKTEVWGAAPLKTVEDAWKAGENPFLSDVTMRRHTIAEIDTEIGVLDAALALAATQQATIDAEVADTEEKIENSVNNEPIDYLTDKLNDAINDFKTDENWADVVAAISHLNAEETYQAWFDQPDTYSDYMIHKTDSFYTANAAILTPNQMIALDKALAAARIANAEYKDSRYQSASDLERKYILKRMYYSSLALEYAMIMTTDGSNHSDSNLQLAESIFLVAVAAVSKNGDIDDFYAVIEEGNDIFRSKTATEEEKAEANRKLRALLTESATAINSVEGAEQLRDGKYFKDGQIIIVKGGKKFNAAGLQF